MPHHPKVSDIAGPESFVESDVAVFHHLAATGSLPVTWATPDLSRGDKKPGAAVHLKTPSVCSHRTIQQFSDDAVTGASKSFSPSLGDPK